MTRCPRSISVSLLLLTLVAGGCASLPTQPGQPIGLLRVSGPNVWLNGAPARNGDQVAIGSSLATGPGSSALLEFRDGGYLQLDQNTDPIFEWLAQSKCILVRIFKGQAYLKRERACVEGPNLSMVLNSEANIRIHERPGLSEVTLLQGRAEITAPARLTLQPGQRFSASERRIAALRTLSREELAAVVAWRASYRFKPLPATKPKVPIILWPKPPRPPEPGRPDQPKPETPAPTEPPSPEKPKRSWPALERDRLPSDLIERRPEPVIR